MTTLAAALLLSLTVLVVPTAEAGEPLFEPYELYPILGGTEAVAVGDLNGDDRPDFATADGCSGSCPFAIFLQQADGTFAVSQEFELGEQESVAIGDLDGDGLNDLIVPRFNAVGILYQKSPGVFDDSIKLPAAIPAFRTLVGDFNHDQRDDALSLPWGSGTDDMDLYTQEVDGSLTHTVLQVEHYGFDDIEGGDLNGDGRDDVVVASGQGTTTQNVAVLLQGDGGLEAPVYYDFGISSLVNCLAIADVTGDGRDDVLASLRNGTDFVVGILVQTPQGDLTPGPLSPAPSSIRGCEAADLDLDGHADIALIGVGSSVTVLKGSASGAFVLEGDYPVPFMNGDRHGVRLADVDRNGSIDLVVAADNDGVAILRSLAHNLFSDGFETGDISAWSSSMP